MKLNYQKLVWFCGIFLVGFTPKTSAQNTNRSTSTSTTVQQEGVVLGKNLEFVEGKLFDLENKKGTPFKSTIKVLEYDPLKNQPRYFATLLIGVGNTTTFSSSSNVWSVTGKFKYFTNTPALRYDFLGNYNFGNHQTSPYSRISGSAGIQYVPFRFKSNPIGLFSKNIYFSKGYKKDPVTNQYYTIAVEGKYKIVREIGFRAGALYNGVNFKFPSPTDGGLYSSQASNLGGYIGVSYGTLRNLVIGSNNMGVHKKNKYNEIVFDVLYAPTTFTTDYTGANKPTDFSDVGYRLLVNFIKPSFHRKLSLQIGAELAKYPGINSGYFGLHIGAAFTNSKKYDTDEISNEINTFVIARDSLNDVDSIKKGIKATYDFITKNKKGYYILQEKRDDLLKKPMKMLTVSRQFLVTTTTTNQTTDSKGRVINSLSNKTSNTQKVSVNYYYGALGGSEYTVPFTDYKSPKKYQQSMLCQYLKEVPAANQYYLSEIKANRRWRRVLNSIAVLSLTSFIVATQTDQPTTVKQITAVTTLATGFATMFAPDMDKKEFDKALSIYNKGLTGKPPRK